MDRRIKTHDFGGINELMPWNSENLKLNFAIQACPTKEVGKWLATRSHALLAYSSNDFVQIKSNTKIKLYQELREHLAH